MVCSKKVQMMETVDEQANFGYKKNAESEFSSSTFMIKTTVIWSMRHVYRC